MNISDEEIKEIAENIIKNRNNENLKIGNLYFANYSYAFNMKNTSLVKSGDSDSGDTSNFYGNNSAILAKDKANLTLKNITVTTNASGANGVFSYGCSALCYKYYC